MERGKKGKNAILQMDRVMRVLSGFDLPSSRLGFSRKVAGVHSSNKN